jgi:hypothetical protein
MFKKNRYQFNSANLFVHTDGNYVAVPGYAVPIGSAVSSLHTASASSAPRAVAIVDLYGIPHLFPILLSAFLFSQT